MNLIRDDEAVFVFSQEQRRIGEFNRGPQWLPGPDTARGHCLGDLMRERRFADLARADQGDRSLARQGVGD